MLNEEIVDNGVKKTGTSCESFSPGRCSVEQQCRPGRHHDTASGDRRRKWTRQENEFVMECYLRSGPERTYGEVRIHLK